MAKPAKKKKKTRTGHGRKKWLQLEADFIGGKWDDLPAMAKETGIPVSTLEKHSASDGWWAKRGDLETQAAQRVNAKVLRLMVEKGYDVRKRWLDMAAKGWERIDESLKGKAPISDANLASAIRAMADLEARAMGLQPSSSGPNLHLHQHNATPAAAGAQPGFVALPPHDVALELSDDDLARIARAAYKAQGPAPARIIEAKAAQEAPPKPSAGSEAKPAPAKGPRKPAAGVAPAEHPAAASSRPIRNAGPGRR